MIDTGHTGVAQTHAPPGLAEDPFDSEAFRSSEASRSSAPPTSDLQHRLRTAAGSGARSAVTGGAQMNGFNLVRDVLCGSGLPKAHVYCEKYLELPGWYRPEKKWDLLIVSEGKLLAGIEFKSQVGSFGNNYNNRTEEAIGSATDI